MLVVTANWCLSDGTLTRGPSPGLLDRLWGDLRRTVLRQGFRHDGRYEPVAAVDLVLAGDTFDWLTSRDWLGEARPWQAGGRTAAIRSGVVAATLARAGRLVAAMEARARRGLLVPDADRRGRPLPSARRRIPVTVTLLSGDRDHGLDRESAFDAARGRGIAVGGRWASDSTAVWHGAEFDPLGGEDPAAGAVRDSITVDLLARFAATVAQMRHARDVAAGLAEDLVRGHAVAAPLTIARRLDAAVRRRAAPTAAVTELRDGWNAAVAAWHRVARRLGGRGAAGRDLVDPLAGWFTLGVEWAERLMQQPPPQCVAAVGCPPVPPLPLVVLGHPPALLAGLPVWRGRVVCLGGGPPAVIADPAARGAAVAMVPGDGDPARLEWLPSGVGAPTIGVDCGGPATLGVWRSDVTVPRPRVLDAA